MVIYMRKVGYLFLTLVELFLLLGGYLIQYFTKKKMGMARYVIYKNQRWERDYPIESWKTSVLLLIVLLTVAVVIFYIIRRNKLMKMTSMVNGGMVVMTVFYTVFTAMNSIKTLRAFYFISPILALVAIVQIIKAFAAILTDSLKESANNEKGI